MKVILKIKELRQKKGLTQKELAEKLNIHQVMISEYETGKSYPSFEKAIQIAYILECTVDDLVDMKKYLDEYHE